MQNVQRHRIHERLNNHAQHRVRATRRHRAVAAAADDNTTAGRTGAGGARINTGGRTLGGHGHRIGAGDGQR